MGCRCRLVHSTCAAYTYACAAAVGGGVGGGGGLAAASNSGERAVATVPTEEGRGQWQR